MKKILLSTMMLIIASCNSSKDYITVTGYIWSVTLKNGDYATGATQTEKDGKKNIKEFSNSRNSNVKKEKIKKVDRKIKKSKFN